MSTATQERPRTMQIRILPDKKPMERPGMFVGNANYSTNEYKGRKTHKRTTWPPKVLIPCIYTAYVKRLMTIDGKVVEKGGSYEGHIQFLAKNERGGEHMEIRYLQASPSLDKKWQDKNGYKPQSDEETAGRLWQGGLDYDIPIEADNELYRTFLANHPYNGDNKNRPDNYPIYFAVKNGLADVQARRQRMEAEKKIADFKMALATDDNMVEVFTVIYRINTAYDLNSRRETLLSKFDEKNGAEKVMKRAETFFTEMKNRFQYLLNNAVLEVRDEKLLNKTDKTIYLQKVKFGADTEKFADILINECNSNHKILSQWIEIEKQLNN